MSILTDIYKTVFPVKKTNVSTGGVGGGGAGGRDGSSSTNKNIEAIEILPPKKTPPPKPTPTLPKNNGGSFGGGGGGGGFPTQTQTTISQPSPSAENFNKDISEKEFNPKTNRFSDKKTTRTSFSSSADDYLNLGAGKSFSGLQTLPKPDIIITSSFVSDVSKVFTGRGVTPARQNIYNQRLTQNYEFQKDTIKRFENDPLSFQGKTGFSSSGMTTKAGEVVTYSLSDDYFKTYTPQYNVKKPNFISYLADVELGVKQVGGDVGYYQRNIYLSAFQNTKTIGKDLGFGIKEFIPKNKYQLNLDKTPTYSKTPIAVGVTVASVGSLGVSSIKNIKNLGLVRGSIYTVEGLSPIRMNREFYPKVNYNSNLAEATVKQINPKTYKATIKNFLSEDVISIDNKNLGTVKGEFSSISNQVKIKGGYNVEGFKTSVNPKITYDPISSQAFKFSTYKTTDSFYYNFPKSNLNIKPSGAVINEKIFIGKYYEGTGLTISKNIDNTFTYRQGKAYGVKVGTNKRFLTNFGELQTTNYNIKGTGVTYRNFQEDVLKSFTTAKVRVLTPKKTPTNKFFSIDNRGTNKPFRSFTSEFKSDKPLEIYKQPTIPKETTTSIRIKSEQIPKLKNIVVFTPQDYSYASSDLSKQYQNFINIPSFKQQTLQIPRQINLQKVITTPVQITRDKTKVITDFGYGSRTTQIPRLDTSQSFTTFYPSPPNIPDTKVPKINPIIPLIPSMDFDFGLSSRKFKGRQVKRYTPSYESFIFKISGNIPKGIETGLRTRPIPKGFKLFRRFR